MEKVIWDIEANKVTSLLKEGKRVDGRKFDERRKVTVQKNISDNAEGSAKVNMGKTEVIAGVRAFAPGKSTI